jgi:hypothetical protein
MEPIEFVYSGDYDMSHMVNAFCDQCNISFGNGGDRKFSVGEVYIIRETEKDSSWYEWGFVKTINGAFGRQDILVYTGICITQDHADEVLLYINGPDFIKIR